MGPWTFSRTYNYCGGMTSPISARHQRGGADESPKSPNAPLYRPVHPVRFVTAASLFDGHDAAINIMRRLLQAQGAEVIHLGHNRSVDEVVTAAIAEDVQGVAISSYQGGHVEYFNYLVDRLRAEGRGDIHIYGGGGGVIVPAEIAELEAYGVRRIFSPADGQRLGLERMINVLIEECDRDLAAEPPPSIDCSSAGTPARWPASSPASRPAGRRPDARAQIGRGRPTAARPRCSASPGTGGSGKSSLTDELILPVPAGPGGQAPHRRAGRRPHPAPRGRGPARRPHPHERHRLAAGVLPVAGHPGVAVRDPPAVAAGRRGLPGRRLRPGHRRDARASVRATPPSWTSPTSRST